MTPFARLLAATSLTGALAAIPVAAQNAPQTADPQATTGTPVAIIGCVERTLATPPDAVSRTTASSTAQPAPAYKLIDAQPGGGSPVQDPTGRVSAPAVKGPATTEPQYWLAGPATIEFVKYQNQRVEVIGTLSPVAKTATAEPTPPDAPKTVLTATNVRVLSTECK